jgi:hypothetical protein
MWKLEGEDFMNKCNKCKKQKPDLITVQLKGTKMKLQMCKACLKKLLKHLKRERDVLNRGIKQLESVVQSPREGQP